MNFREARAPRLPTFLKRGKCVTTCFSWIIDDAQMSFFPFLNVDTLEPDAQVKRASWRAHTTRSRVVSFSSRRKSARRSMIFAGSTKTEVVERSLGTCLSYTQVCVGCRRQHYALRHHYFLTVCLCDYSHGRKCPCNLQSQRFQRVSRSTVTLHPFALYEFADRRPVSCVAVPRSWKSNPRFCNQFPRLVQHIADGPVPRFLQSFSKRLVQHLVDPACIGSSNQKSLSKSYALFLAQILPLMWQHMRL